MTRINPKNWIFTVPDERSGSYILFAPLQKFAVRISNEAKTKIDEILDDFEEKNNSENFLLKYLKENRLLSFPQSWTSKGIQKEKRNPKLTLSLTNKCNLRCIYCYAETGLDFLTMPWDIAKAAITYIIQRALSEKDDKVFITFHGGGEAFVEFALMKKCVEYAKRKSKENDLNIHFNVVTNATLIDTKKASWMKDYGFDHITVSLDSIEEVNDLQRKDLKGKGSFSRVMKGINNLNQAQLSFSIRSTITNFSVEKMADFVEYASKNIFSEKGLIHFEPISLCGRAKTISLTTNSEIFFKNYLKAKEIGYRCNIKIKSSLDTFKREKKYYCGASFGTMFCVVPSGYVTACSRVTKPTDEGSDLYFYGEYDKENNSFKIDQKKIKNIISHGSLPKSCKTCIARWNCQGGCPIIRYPDTKGIKDTCVITRKLLKHYLISEIGPVYK